MRKSVRNAALTAFAVSLFSGGAAMAQSYNSGGHFDGLYAGFEAGLDHADIRSDVLVGQNAFSQKGNSDGIYYGGFAGWRTEYQSGLVLGLEGRYGGSTARVKSSIAGIDFPDLSLRGGLGRTLGVDAVAGLATGPDKSILVFASGGVTNTRIKSRAEGTVSGVSESVKFSDATYGYRVGGGAELALTDAISARVTAHYEDYGRKTDSIKVLGGLALRF